ncbi:MAG: hypothetical protein A2201_05060 [Alicyclobacillus sp. RIFOXYA1_FULL_53_8]|nr:MAG: hypothetical protein A2201_05060 [Alicyclobacillus sp. RIFOXYA1_FULL_53_8]
MTLECKEISAVDMKSILFGYNRVQIVDVREVDEYRDGHIEGSTLIPLGILPYRVDTLKRDQPVVLVCRSGNRSAQACQILRDRGFDAVSLRGGLTNWHSA